MKHRDGYLISGDDVMQLELEVIEDIAYRVFKDSYLTEEAKLDILDVYLDSRWRKKEKTFVYNEENLKRVSDMNDLLIRQTKDAVKPAAKTLVQILDKKGEVKKSITAVASVLPRRFIMP